ncbi:hypothetical protein HLB44_20405 [Aquincola sp. S2]|uniref:DUF4902 domain-containing protein n=1 Tax=Pseudaquabacterium terrae TaxID=2732868 RepID=A0ABX2EL59_9BURK|nr:hypothetical protein [Aquabacterium terrae]NRF69365.1 hypothetical protein [Aquabacterium terrae]
MTATAAPYCPTWSLHAWKPVFWQLDRISTLRLRHLGTHVTQSPSPSPSGPQADPAHWPGGHTLWAAHHERHGDVALAWNWMVDERCGAVLIRDPFGIVTNLRFVAADGEVLTAYHATLHLGVIVRSLPWTEEVLRGVYGTELTLAAAA